MGKNPLGKWVMGTHCHQELQRDSQNVDIQTSRTPTPRGHCIEGMHTTMGYVKVVISMVLAEAGNIKLARLKDQKGMIEARM
jgi:hypothetical protein